MASLFSIFQYSRQRKIVWIRTTDLWRRNQQPRSTVPQPRSTVPQPRSTVPQPKLLSLSFLVVLSMFTWLHKHKNNKNCCGGQGVSVLAFYSDDLSSNPAEIYSFYPVNYLIRTRWKLPRCGQIYKCSKIASIAPKSNLRSDKTNSRFVNYDRLGVIGFQKPAQMAIAFGVRCGM